MQNLGHRRQGSLGTTLSTLNLGHHRSHSLLSQNSSKLQTMHNLREITAHANKIANKYNITNENQIVKDNYKNSNFIKPVVNNKTKQSNISKENNQNTKENEIIDQENNNTSKLPDKIINIMQQKRDNRRSSTTEIKRAFADISNKTIDENISKLSKFNNNKYVFDSQNLKQISNSHVFNPPEKIKNRDSLTTTSIDNDNDKPTLFMKRAENYIKNGLTNSISDSIIFNIDKEDITNAQAINEYAQRIFCHLKREESKQIPDKDYMKTKQNDINEKMRSILIDWLVEVHVKFKLLPETLFLTVNLIDRYLELKKVMRQKLQLIGVTSMLIASKYEEIYAPEVKDFVYITDKAYTAYEILDMERTMLITLNFNTTTTSSLRFLERYAKILKLDDNLNRKTFQLARQILELCLIDNKMLRYTQNQQAVAASYLSIKILKNYPQNDWRKILTEQSELDETQIRDCAKAQCLLMQNAQKASLQAVRKKYGSEKQSRVSTIQLEKN